MYKCSHKRFYLDSDETFMLQKHTLIHVEVTKNVNMHRVKFWHFIDDMGSDNEEVDNDNDIAGALELLDV